MSKIVLDPSNERAVLDHVLLPRPSTIKGHVVGLFDISKPRGDVFLNRIEQRLVDHGATVIRYKKPTFTKPAPVDLRHEIAVQCTLVIEALAD